MKSEKEIEEMAARAADEINRINGLDVVPDSQEVRRERLRTVRDALDWVLGDGDDPL